MNDEILRVDDIQKYYGNKGSLTKAVDHISFTVDKGEFLGIMGPSGSGKTTLLNCISTIDTVTSGHIFVEGQDITTLHGGRLSDFRGRKLGFIFQDFNLLDTLTAYENVSLALSIAGVKTADCRGAEHFRSAVKIPLPNVGMSTATYRGSPCNGYKSSNRTGR